MQIRNFKTLFFFTILLTISYGLPAQAADYQSMTTEELSQIRGSLYNASQEERDAFHEEWNNRLANMDATERDHYTSSAPGRGNGLRDGSGAGRQGGSGQGLGNGNGGSGGGAGNGRGGKGGGKGRK
jgi:hypothetical protein